MGGIIVGQLPQIHVATLVETVVKLTLASHLDQVLETTWTYFCKYRF